MLAIDDSVTRSGNIFSTFPEFRDFHFSLNERDLAVGRIVGSQSNAAQLTVLEYFRCNHSVSIVMYICLQLARCMRLIGRRRRRYLALIPPPHRSWPRNSFLKKTIPSPRHAVRISGRTSTSLDLSALMIFADDRLFPRREQLR
jgi:hypothetical protein